MSIMCRIDDKQVPLYRVMWVAATPHFCGEEDCLREGFYEVRLEQGESIWASAEEQATLIEKIDQWQGGMGPTEEEDW